MPEVAKPRMVTLAREAKGLSQAQVAEAIKDVAPDGQAMSQAFISKVEAGLLDLSGERLKQVAAVLDCPVALLVDDTPIQGVEVTCLHHRRRHSKINAVTMRRIEAITHLSRVSVEGLLSDVELAPEVELQRLDIDAYGGDPAAVARALRAAWRVPTGPIQNVLALLEAVGIIIVIRPLGTRAQDAVSTWPHGPGQPPIMVLTAGLDPDRQRFTTCHEAGHVIMHTLPSDNQEIEADQFASEFLMPAADIRPALVGLTTRDFPKLLELKSRWGVSIAALIRRARDLGTISDRQYREFQIRLRQMKWHEKEPGTLPPERPATLRRVMEVHVNQHQWSVAELAQAARMNPAPFRARYDPPDPGAPPPTRLRLVP